MELYKRNLPLPSNMRSLGARLRWHRLHLRLSQEALAEEIGASPRSIGRWEQNVAIPQKAVRERLCYLFGIEPEQLLATPSIIDPRLSSSLWTVPSPRNTCFTGREDILHTLHARFTVQQSIAFALSGLGGIGKTQVAIEYAYRHCQHYRGVFWLVAETQESLMSSLQQMISQLHLPKQQASDQRQMLQSVRKWLASSSGWLLIIDNVIDLDLLQTFLPPIHAGTLLLTTRHQALGTLAEPLELPPMTNEEGVTLLLRRARRLAVSPVDPARRQERLETTEGMEAEKLVHLLEGLPLALDQAGAYLEETGCSVAEYLQRYYHCPKQMLARRGLHAGAHPDSVTTTIQFSIEQIERENPTAMQLLKICAFFHPEAIPEELFVVGASYPGSVLEQVITDSYQFDLALAVLRSASLIRRQPEQRTLSLHRLVQLVLQDQMEHSMVRFWSQQAVLLVAAAFPDGSVNTWMQCEHLLRQALVCVRLIERVGNDLPEASVLLYNVGSYLMARGRYREAEPLLKQSVVLEEQHHGFNHLLLIAQLEKQAELFWRLGQYESVEPLLRRLLALRERYLGANHPQTAETLNNLADLYQNQGKLELAEPLYQRAAQIEVSLTSPED